LNVFRDIADFRTLVLLPASGLYALGWMAYEAIYQLGWKKAARPHRPVICVGNLTVGGMGKTPVTAYVAETLLSLGHQVVISANGYRSPRQEGATLAPEGDLDAREWGDEPALLRQMLADVPLVIGRRRVEAAKIVHERFPNAVMLMDDGVQHLPLRRDITILLEPEKTRNPFCLPAGPYREPRKRGLRKADLVLPRPPFDLSAQYGDLIGDPIPEGADVQIVTAIAQPERFRSLVEHMGYRVVAGRFWPDHDPLDRALDDPRLRPGVPLLTTQKDWVKLGRHRDRFDGPLAVIPYRVAIEPEDRFRQWLKEKLDGVLAEKS
jgi:tetraacyldisaccharide 4'-kinase